MTINYKECQFCGYVKISQPTPDGDEVCPNCGDREMLDLEPVEEIPQMEGTLAALDKITIISK